VPKREHIEEEEEEEGEEWAPPKFEVCAVTFGNEFVVMLVSP
jgi:hypothetical protein